LNLNFKKPLTFAASNNLGSLNHGDSSIVFPWTYNCLKRFIAAVPIQAALVVLLILKLSLLYYSKINYSYSEPLDTTRRTWRPSGTAVPGSGRWEMTLFLETSSLYSCSTVPILRPSLLNADSARA